jgi:TPR repeat protein
LQFRRTIATPSHGFVAPGSKAIPTPSSISRIYGKAEGLYLKRGRVVPQDNVEAAKWLRRAADQGYLPAQAKLGELLMEGGHGLSADLVDAYYWLSKAASAGDAQAKKTLTDLTTKMTTEHLSAAKANAASKK